MVDVCFPAAHRAFLVHQTSIHIPGYIVAQAVQRFFRRDAVLDDDFNQQAAVKSASGLGFADGVEHTAVVEIPVVGRIAAGTPILAEQNIEDSFPVPARFVGSGTTFMLTVRGESMIEAGIMDGDYILVEQQNTARNGDIVVAMVDGFESEATVKTFYKEADHIRLQPENSTMSPILVHDVKILGKVKGVFRYF
jgi:repressor LexA